MPNQFVDRGLPLNGINRTLKDAKVDYRNLREARNFRLTDGRPERRPGYQPHNEVQMTGDQLMKHTGTVVATSLVDTQIQKAKAFKSPFSYGLIRWHDDYQIKSDRDWTIEFNLTLGDIESLVQAGIANRQLSAGLYNAASARLTVRAAPGVFVLDQTVLAKDFRFTHPGWATTDTPVEYNTTGAIYVQDVFAVSTISISYDLDGIHIWFAFFESLTKTYYPFYYSLTIPFPGGYVSGDTYHVAVRYNSSNQSIDALRNGSPVASMYLPPGFVFAGENDKINGIETPIHRDFVILNECTARGGYSSTCKVGDSNSAQHGNYCFPHYTDTTAADDAPYPPRMHSPPRGTGMSELRFWHEFRSQALLSVYKDRSLPFFPDELVGYWRMNDGGPICLNSLPEDRRHMTIHHGEAAYIEDDGLLHKTGIVFADNQCARLGYGPEDYKYIRESHKALNDVFSYDVSNRFQPTKDFTLQIQFRTPTVFQQEINKVNGAATLACSAGDTRDKMGHQNYRLTNGKTTPDPVRFESGVGDVWHRAYDSTLFAIEGIQRDLSNQTDNDRDVTRIPLARGLLTPAGKVAFEYFAAAAIATAPREYRITSNTTLSPDTVYTVTFVRKTTYTYADGAPTPTGTKIEIYLNNSQTADRSLALVATAGHYHTPMEHDGTTDVIIGSSYFTDHMDKSISDGASTPRAVSQRFMSPYQDQPGFFTLGFFRLWKISIPPRDFSRYASSTLAGISEYRSDLIYNIEVDVSTGPFIKSRGVYEEVFELDYKGWGSSEFELILGTKEAYPGCFAFQDRLGYGPRASRYVELGEVTTRGLAVYSSTLSQRKGLLAVIDNSLYHDVDAGGVLNWQALTARGLLNDFFPCSCWQGTSIADRTVLTAPGGYPKVFDGKVATLLGPDKWRGGRIKISVTQTGGSLQVSKWYGIRIIYVSESSGVISISPAHAITTIGGTPEYRKILVENVPASPDPRVSSIIIARTIAQETKALALVAPVFPISDTIFANEFIESFTVDDDTAITTVSYDATQYSQAPLCAYSASLNDKLYLAGDPLVPDRIFWSQAGNPEVFDNTQNQMVLEESQGDKINGLIGLFGSLYVFKENSIWRVVEISDGVHQKEQIASVGPVSDRSIAIVIFPDTGRVAFVFWSHYGPYLCDTVNTQYLGYPLEGINADFNAIMDTRSVFVVHDASKREMLFFYKSRNADGVAVARHDRAFVYNYRSNTWVEYDGVLGNVGLASSFIKRELPTFSEIDQFHLVLIGGTNGFIYKWNSSIYDGLPPEIEQNVFTVTSYDSGRINYSEPGPRFESHELRHLWITVINKKEDQWFIAPVVDNGGSSVTIDTSFASFEPGADSTLIVGLVPAFIELPWDDLGVPYQDKRVTQLVTWNVGDFKLGYAKDWDETKTREGWINVLDAGGRRNRTAIAIGTSEVLKTTLVSFKPVAKLNGFGYVADVNSQATNIQP